MTSTNERHTGSGRSDEIRSAVREQYGQIARGGGRPEPGEEPVQGQPSAQRCCGPSPCGSGPEMSLAMGYSAEDLASVPEGANLGLGCGNPQAIANLKPGEVVLDLGAGGGFDCFLAARQVGPEGQVIGVDMTPDMVVKARANAARIEAGNVEFRLGEIEHLPVADRSIDVILSNCVINLSPDKASVFREAFRALRPGGRLAISDTVALAPLPSGLVDEITEMTGCVSSITAAEIEELLSLAGFENISVQVDAGSRELVSDWAPGTGIEDYVASARIEATRPESAACCGPSCCQGQASR